MAKSTRTVIATTILLMGWALSLFNAAPSLASTPSKGPKGDPGGVILRELKTLRLSVPTTVHVRYVLAKEPHLTRSCTSTTPDVQVDVAFTSRDAVGQLQGLVGKSLRAKGWRYYSKSGPSQWYDQIDGRQQLASNYIFRWQKVFPQRRTAVATLQVGVPSTGWVPGAPLSWDIGSAVRGIGEPAMHCGSG
ncbi:MAG TPA: hypothetical protein VGH31_09105 [Acidimicrobiales bacterium]